VCPLRGLTSKKGITSCHAPEPPLPQLLDTPLLERLGRCALGQLGAENASACGRRGDIDLLALEPGVLLVGDQVLGELGGILDRGADDRGAAQGAPGPVPLHRVTPEDVGKRHVKLP
jgi:hypothetical protein